MPLDRHVRMLRELIESEQTPTVADCDRYIAHLQAEGADREILDVCRRMRAEFAEAAKLRERAALSAVN